jgi:hypothetical protein
VFHFGKKEKFKVFSLIPLQHFDKHSLHSSFEIVGDEFLTRE